MTIEFFVSAVVALAVGLLLGWLLGGRRHAGVHVELARVQERAGQADRLQPLLEAAEARAARLEIEHSRMCEQNDYLRPMRAELVVERDHHAGEAARLATELAELRARVERDEAHHAALVAELKDVRESLPLQFGAVAKQALDEAQAAFLKRADDRFKESEATSGAQLGALLAPVHERLQRYEEAVGKVELERRGAFSELKSQMEHMRAGTDRVSGEAAKLVNALRDGPKKRGSWGELQLKNLLESCGLSQHTDFRTEVNVDTDDGRLRPDAVVTIPGGRSLVIDAKVSLNAYQDAVDATEDDARGIAMTRHVASMKNHVNTLGAKSYQSRFESLDYVIMFVPGEQFVSAALEHDPTLWDHAFEKKVLIATPANLIAILRTVAAVWRQEKLASEAKRIGELGKEMYDRLAVVAERLAQTGTSLNRTVGSFNSAMTAFNGNLTTTGKRFRELNIEVGKRELDDVPAIEALATHLSPEASVSLPLLAAD